VRRIGTSELEGHTLKVRAKDGASAVPAVLAALEAQGLRAASLTLARPSLDEVYLRHAGRSFAAGETERVGQVGEKEAA
jgi:ABC-2 type transport system ATP-binding protein